MGNMAKDMMSGVMSNPTLEKALRNLGFKTENENEMTFEEAMTASMIASAVRGDPRAYKTMQDKIAEKALKMPLETFIEQNTVASTETSERGQI